MILRTSLMGDLGCCWLLLVLLFVFKVCPMVSANLTLLQVTEKEAAAAAAAIAIVIVVNLELTSLVCTHWQRSKLVGTHLYNLSIKCQIVS